MWTSSTLHRPHSAAPSSTISADPVVTCGNSADPEARRPLSIQARAAGSRWRTDFHHSGFPHSHTGSRLERGTPGPPHSGPGTSRRPRPPTPFTPPSPRSLIPRPADDHLRGKPFVHKSGARTPERPPSMAVPGVRPPLALYRRPGHAPAGVPRVPVAAEDLPVGADVPRHGGPDRRRRRTTPEPVRTVPGLDTNPPTTLNSPGTDDPVKGRRTRKGGKVGT